MTFGTEKLERCGYPILKKNLKICLFVSTEFTNATDGQTDGHRITQHRPRLCIASCGKITCIRPGERHFRFYAETKSNEYTHDFKVELINDAWRHGATYVAWCHLIPKMDMTKTGCIQHSSCRSCIQNFLTAASMFSTSDCSGMSSAVVKRDLIPEVDMALGETGSSYISDCRWWGREIPVDKPIVQIQRV